MLGRGSDHQPSLGQRWAKQPSNPPPPPPQGRLTVLKLRQCAGLFDHLSVPEAEALALTLLAEYRAALPLNRTLEKLEKGHGQALPPPLPPAPLGSRTGPGGGGHPHTLLRIVDICLSGSEGQREVGGGRLTCRPPRPPPSCQGDETERTIFFLPALCAVNF